MSSLVFVVSSLEAIAASKEAHRNKQLAELTEKALNAIKDGGSQLPEPQVVFAPLQLATKTGSSQLINTALDCLEFPRDQWKFVRRLHINAQGDPDNYQIDE